MKKKSKIECPDQVRFFNCEVRFYRNGNPTETYFIHRVYEPSMLYGFEFEVIEETDLARKTQMTKPGEEPGNHLLITEDKTQPASEYWF